MSFYEINYNIANIATDGYDFVGSDSVRIDAHFQESSVQQEGVYSQYDGCTLFNFGRVASTNSGFGAVDFRGKDGTIANELGGTILASGSGSNHTVGVYIDGINGLVANFGNIISAHDTGVELGQDTNNARVFNYGSIYGGYTGIYEGSQNEGGTIYNRGTIRSTGVGIEVATNDGFVTSITNIAHGIITGKSAAIEIGPGGILLNNHGTINGTILGENGYSINDDAIYNFGRINGEILLSANNDYLRNHGNINGLVYLSSNSDIFDGRGGTSGKIFCGSNDRVIAGKGNVTIDVGYGNNTLTGGHGHDQFIFDSPVVAQVDVITNFKHGLDEIVLSSHFAGLGPAGALNAANFHLGSPVSGHAQIDYLRGSGVLEYCRHGDHGRAEVFAVLSNHAGISASDFHLLA